MAKKNKGNKRKKFYVTGEIVLSAIKKLTKNTGWTTRTIIKFIKMEYGCNDPKLSRDVSRALKRGARLGLLHAEGGRYRLNNMARLAVTSSAETNFSDSKTRNLSLRIRSDTHSEEL